MGGAVLAGNSRHGLGENVGEGDVPVKNLAGTLQGGDDLRRTKKKFFGGQVEKIEILQKLTNVIVRVRKDFFQDFAFFGDGDENCVFGKILAKLVKVTKMLAKSKF